MHLRGMTIVRKTLVFALNRVHSKHVFLSHENPIWIVVL